MKQFAGRFSR